MRSKEGALARDAASRKRPSEMVLFIISTSSRKYSIQKLMKTYFEKYGNNQGYIWNNRSEHLLTDELMFRYYNNISVRNTKMKVIK